MELLKSLLVGRNTDASGFLRQRNEAADGGNGKGKTRFISLDAIYSKARRLK